MRRRGDAVLADVQSHQVRHHGGAPGSSEGRVGRCLVDHLVEDGHDVTVARTSRPDVDRCTALDWTTPTCSVAGCDQPRREIDHRDDWARTHHTVLHELDPYCKFHHYLKGHKGYRLETGTGRRRLLPPDPDPPHPP